MFTPRGVHIVIIRLRKVNSVELLRLIDLRYQNLRQLARLAFGKVADRLQLNLTLAIDQLIRVAGNSDLLELGIPLEALEQLVGIVLVLRRDFYLRSL